MIRPSLFSLPLLSSVYTTYSSSVLISLTSEVPILPNIQSWQVVCEAISLLVPLIPNRV